MCSLKNIANRTRMHITINPFLLLQYEVFSRLLPEQLWQQRTNPMETATGKKRKSDTLVEWATSRKYKIMNTIFQEKALRKWAWKSPSGVTKTEIYYILTNRPDVVTDVTVINQVNISTDHILILSNIKLDVEMENKMYDQRGHHE